MPKGGALGLDRSNSGCGNQTCQIVLLCPIGELKGFDVVGNGKREACKHIQDFGCAESVRNQILA